ncbi:hypothetical protein BDY21DRAFT_372968 [Lineolata rhizophorae]|uniref:Uncharacterized protein n=1 Tax=Lineolata rhizophorae TaxID=578093 RepID=A0A6A6NVU5_9PEZI|nr:hypothetical protein BDY21DRAFT_372968 [Lineolata rhizophorae]
MGRHAGLPLPSLHAGSSPPGQHKSTLFLTSNSLPLHHHNHPRTTTCFEQPSKSSIKAFETTHTMPANNQSQTTSGAKAQPWKANWPPKTAVQPGESHGFKKGETLQLEGSAGAHPKQEDGSHH